MKAKGIIGAYGLSGNTGFTLPSNIGELGDDWQNTNKFAGGIPSEWGALANLKELKMVACGLDGKLLSTRSERLHSLLIITFLSRMLAQGARKARQFERVQRLQQQD